MAAANRLIAHGDKAGARSQLEALWTRVVGSAIHECIVAHILADAQDDPADELEWDRAALEAAMRCTDADVQAHTPVASIAAFMPSLHMSLAQDYLKLRDLTASREHLTAARSFERELTDDAYGQTIRGAMQRVAGYLDRLEGSAQPSA